MLDDGSSGTLRSVISDAEASSGAQTIVFDSSLTATTPATITLDGFALEVNHTSGGITIQGPTNNQLTIDQSVGYETVGDFAVFKVDSSTTADIENLKITGGYKSYLRDDNVDGGGIDSSGTLTINNCTITGNTAEFGGGIYQQGSAPLYVNNSIISDNIGDSSGGGIWGTNVTVSASTITGNGAGNVGGGIAATNATVSSSTLSNNYAAEFGGGVYASGDLTITGSTVSENVAGTGGGVGTGYDSTLSMADCTIALNQGDAGSGVDTAGYATIVDSTISGNSSPDYGAGVYNVNYPEYTIVIQGSIVDGNGTDISGYFAPTDDLIGTLSDAATQDPDYSDSEVDNTFGVDANLAPLGWYGGPTETMPPTSGSPAISAYGGEYALTRSTTDQRGFPVSNDLGAFQTQTDPLDVNTTSDDPVASGYLSLRDAVNLGSVLGGNQTITFDSSLTTGTINLTGTALEMDDTSGTLTIDGTDSATPITVNAASGSGAFTVDSGSTAEIDGLTIGGAVTTAGTLTLNGDINPTANNFSVEVLDGGTLNLPTSTELASLTIDAGGLAQQTSTDTTFGSEVLTVGSLTIDDPSGSTNGGVLDLGNGDLIVQGTPATDIEPLLAAGFDGGLWDGQAASGPNPAAIISSGAANDPYQIESLGYAQIGSDTDDGELDLSTFDGQTVNSGDTVVELTYYGDANLDRTVNSTDYDMIGAEYPYIGENIGGWTGGDFNYDGAVTSSDYTLYETSVTTIADAPNLSATNNTPSISSTAANPSGTSIISDGTSRGVSVKVNVTTSSTGAVAGDIQITNTQGATQTTITYKYVGGAVPAGTTRVYTITVSDPNNFNGPTTITLTITP